MIHFQKLKVAEKLREVTEKPLGALLCPREAGVGWGHG